jgi:hypothetical protein
LSQSPGTHVWSLTREVASAKDDESSFEEVHLGVLQAQFVRYVQAAGHRIFAGSLARPTLLLEC